MILSKLIPILIFEFDDIVNLLKIKRVFSELVHEFKVKLMSGYLMKKYIILKPDNWSYDLLRLIYLRYG